jgi:hypothetical protein
MILPVEIKEEERVLQLCENGPKMYIRTKFLYNLWDIEEIRFLCEKVGKKIQEGLRIKEEKGRENGWVCFRKRKCKDKDTFVLYAGIVYWPEKKAKNKK